MHQGDFQRKFLEKSELNQYWYSRSTITAIRDELVQKRPQNVAFVSTPSLFFNVCDHIPDSHLFDLDKDFNESTNGRFSEFDYRAMNISPMHRHKYDAVIIDPPFITEDVISAYIEVYLLLAKGSESLLLFTTIAENQGVIARLLRTNISLAPFLPCIPNLVYQYGIFTNYKIHPDSPLSRANPEVIISE